MSRIRNVILLLTGLAAANSQASFMHTARLLPPANDYIVVTIEYFNSGDRKNSNEVREWRDGTTWFTDENFNPLQILPIDGTLNVDTNSSCDGGRTQIQGPRVFRIARDSYNGARELTVRRDFRFLTSNYSCVWTSRVTPIVPSLTCSANVIPSSLSWTLGNNGSGETRRATLSIQCSSAALVTVSTQGKYTQAGEVNIGAGVNVQYQWEQNPAGTVSSSVEWAMFLTPITTGATVGAHQGNIIITVDFV